MISEERLAEMWRRLDIEVMHRPAHSFKEALERSLAKWHPKRGENRGYGNCGLCDFLYRCDGMVFDDDDDEPAAVCPLYMPDLGKSGGGCASEGHPWSIWLNNQTDANADVIYQMLVDAYKKRLK